MNSDIQHFIQQHEKTIRPLQEDYCRKLWDLSLNGDPQREKELVESKERFLHVYNNRDEFRQLQAWKSAAESLDPLQARQFKLIYDGFVPHQIEPDVLRDIVERETQ